MKNLLNNLKTNKIYDKERKSVISQTSCTN